MTNLSATLKLRPTRVGFLIDPSDRDGVLTAMQVCSCLWGGVYNPFIPVCLSGIPTTWSDAPPLTVSSASLAKGYLSFFEPDIFVEVTPGAAKRIGLESAELDFGTKRVTPLAEVLEPLEGKRSETPVGLNVFELYKSLYEREFKFVSRHDHRMALFSAKNVDDQAFVDAAYGAFPSEGALSSLRESYLEAFNPHLLSASPASFQRAFNEGYRTPLSIGRHGIERSPSGGLGDPILFVLDPTSPLDLFDYWNIRLFHSGVIGINARWVGRLGKFMRDFIARNNVPMRGNPQGLKHSTTVQFGRSISEARAKALSKAAKLSELPSGSWQFKLWYDRIWVQSRDDLVWRPKRARLTAESRDIEVQVASEGRNQYVRFPGVSPEFAPTYGNSGAAWVNVLRFRHSRPGTPLALGLPADFPLEITRPWRVGSPIIPSTEGWVLPQQYKDHGEYINLRSGKEAMIQWLKHHGVEAEPSSSGRVAEQVLDSFNGFWSAKLIAHSDTVKLLERMAKSVRKFSDGTAELYQDRTATASEWISHIAKRRNDIWSSHLTLDQFVEANVIRLGLAIECTHCNYTNWFAVGAIGETLTCERCRKSFAFPQGGIVHKATPWRYRVVGPFSVPDFADGAYATVLALRVFSETLSSGHTSITYSTGLNLRVGSEPPLEVDFSLWYRRDSWESDEGEAVPVFGEAKSFAARTFQTKDVQRMRRIAERFPGAFLVFAVLKDALGPEELKEIADLAHWGRQPLDDGRPRAPVIVLTGAELFCPWHVNAAWKDLGGKRKDIADASHLHLENLWTFADLTQQLYLNLPGRSEELRQQWEAARKAAEVRNIAKPAKKSSSPTPRSRK
jgi:hypothetical protein